MEVKDVFTKYTIEVFKPGLATEQLLKAIKQLPPLSLEHGPFIAGGILVRAVLGKNDYNDIDLFCTTTKQFNEVIEHLDRVSTRIVDGERANAVSMGPADPDGLNVVLERTSPIANYQLDDLITVQVIDAERRAIPGAKPLETLLAFDIIPCMIATDGKDVVFQVQALEMLGTGVLGLNTSEYRAKVLELRPFLGENVQERIKKYQALGFKLENSGSAASKDLDEYATASGKK